jgi:hypothetical protein
VYCDDLEDEPSYPAQLDDRDLISEPEESQSPRCPSPPTNRRVARLQRDQTPEFRPPVHQDSGFDEQMIHDLRLEDESATSDKSTESEGEMDSEDEMPQLRPMGTRAKLSNGALAAATRALAR